MPRNFSCLLAFTNWWSLNFFIACAFSIVFFQGIVKSQTSDVLMNSPVKIAADMKTPLLSHEGYDLLNLMACRSGMELVPGFDDLKRKNNGLLMLLGNGHFPLPWIEIENWVRRGGTLLVAFDEAPPRQLQNRLQKLTGFQWSNLRLKYMGDKGVELLPERSFPEIQKLVPFDWSISGKIDSPPIGAKTSGMGHTNSPSFLLSMDGAEVKGTVFARLPPAVELDLAPGMSMRLPAFRADFGVIANVGQGQVIQLADPDIFSNQMLELGGNFQFTWSLLQSIKKYKVLMPGDFSIMIVGQKIESEIFRLPVPPIPLPELDFFQMASQAVMALDEKLPSLEKPGGLFERISNRIYYQMTRTFWLGIGAVIFAMLGLWFFFSQRKAYRSKQIAAKTFEEAIATTLKKAPEKSSAKRQEARGKLLNQFSNFKSATDIPLWELGEMAQVEILKGGIVSPSNSLKRSQMNAAKRLMDWIASGVSVNYKKINIEIKSIIKGKENVLSNLVLNENKHK